MIKIMENLIKMDDLGVPLFLETPILVLENLERWLLLNRFLVGIPPFESRIVGWKLQEVNFPGVCRVPFQGSHRPKFQPTWRIIPVSKWLLTMVSKSPK